MEKEGDEEDLEKALGTENHVKKQFACQHWTSTRDMEEMKGDT